MKQSLSGLKRLIISLLPYLRYKRIMLGGAIAAVALITSLFLSFLRTNHSDILPYRQNIEVLSFNNGLHVAVDDRIIDHTIPGEKCQRISASIDGNNAAFLTDRKELYIVSGQKLHKIADDVLHFEISSSGQGVAFAQKFANQNTLTLFLLKEKTRTEITSSLATLDFSLSPDGKSVAYYSNADGKDILMCYCKGESSQVSHESTDLVGLSNDGKYIYAVCNSNTDTATLYSFNHKGSQVKLGPVTSISFKFNQDHQQIMFYNNGATLVSTNGKEAITASSYPLYLVTAPNSQSASDGNSITLPVTTLFDHVYTCSDGEATSAWMIRKNPEKSERLISRVSGCTLDTSAQYLYFIQDHQYLCVLNTQSKAPEFQILAENIDAYVVSSNRNKVYYTNDNTLYCTNGRKTGTPKLITSGFSGYNLVIGASDILYYLDGKDVYSCINGRRVECIVQNVNSLYNSSNNIVYFIGDDAVYTANIRKKPVKILSND